MLTDTKNSVKLFLFVLIGLSLLTRFIFFDYPAETVFDEVHFGKFISAYFTGEYYFDIHPPLGKIMIAGVAKLVGFQPGFSFENISQKFPDSTYQWLRLLPKIFSALLPLVIFWLALEFGISVPYAFFAGFLILFDNALIVQGRFILLDSFLLIFGFSSLIFYLKFLKSKSAKHILTAGILGVLAGSIKWTGFAFLGLMFLTFFLDYGIGGLKQELKKVLTFLIFIPFIIYFSIFAIHFKFLSNSGSGDAFHTQAFQKTLAGSNADIQIKSLSIFAKFTELNKVMFSSNAGLSATHPYGSKWYQWPFMTRPIYYWNGADDKDARIYLFGNPAIWWITTIGIIFVISEFWSAFYARLRRRLFDLKNFGSPFPLIFIGFLLNLLPFIAIKRVMFLYHYLTALVFAILILAFILDKHEQVKVGKIPLRYLIMGVSVTMFLIFSPITYGLSISPKVYESLVWFSSWR